MEGPQGIPAEVREAMDGSARSEIAKNVLDRQIKGGATNQKWVSAPITPRAASARASDASRPLIPS